MAIITFTNKGELKVSALNKDFESAILALGEFDENAPDGYKKGGKKITDSPAAAAELLAEYAEGAGLYLEDAR